MAFHRHLDVTTGKTQILYLKISSVFSLFKFLNF